MNVTIVCVGKLKESFFREAVAEYGKRISAFAKLEIVEVGESRLPKEPSQKEMETGVEQEGQWILEKIPPKACCVGLFIEGKSMGSEELAAFLQKEQQQTGEFAFVIGGSHGLSKAVAARCQQKLSFSPMTFPHQLMRVLLVEQLYRAFSINSGSKYHK